MNTQNRRKKTKKNTHIYLALLLLFLCLFSFSPNKLQAVEINTENNSDPTAPLLLIKSPAVGETINNKTVAISGVVSDDVSLSEKITLLLYENPDVSKSISADPNGIWSTTIDLSEGEHTIFVKASDESGVTTTASVTFTVKIITPQEPTRNLLNTKTIKVIKKVNIINNDDISRDLLVTTNSTKVKVDTSIIMKVSDTAISNTYTGKTDGEPITLFKKNEKENRLEQVLGTTVYDQRNMQFVFTPTPISETEQALLPSTAYYVFINRAWMDTTISTPEEIGFSFYPKFLKFTTASESSNSPHGNYKPNTNLCKNCHNTHTSTGTKLEEPNFDEMNDIDLKTNNYCMACHDGTVAPLPENINDTHKHSVSVNSDDQPSASSCTSCHDPHLTWTGENPNLFKNHYVYQHNKGDTGVTTTEPIDSEKESCETCHDNATVMKASVREGSYKVYHYRKSSVATGKTGDYALCLRCHNGETKDKNDVLISNIQEFYQDYNPADPNISKHWITQNDGSSLNGNIPCAECHDTHGSNNIKVLKDLLGHENQSTFSALSGEWDANKEKEFCMKCHNGSTAIYGVIGSNLSPEHESTTETCSSCHGGESGSYIEAAHAPKASTKPLK